MLPGSFDHPYKVKDELYGERVGEKREIRRKGERNNLSRQVKSHLSVAMTGECRERLPGYFIRS